MATRQTYYAESLGEDTTTSATYGDKATVTFTPDASSDYYLFWSCLVICDSTSEDAYTRLYNSTDAVVLAEQNQEHRTTSGTPYRASHGIAKYTSGGSPASTSFKIQYRSEVGGTSTRIKEARVLVVKAHADDEYAESLGADTTTSNSYVDTACSLTFTPASQGDYLIFGSADAKTSSSGDVWYLKMVDSASADVGEMIGVTRDATNFNPYTVMVKQNLTAASKTFKFQFHRTAAGTITLQNQRILALRADAFDNVYYAEDRSRATTTSTSYVTDASLTQTPEAKEHIIFNSAFVDNSTTSVSVISQFYEDSTGFGEFNHRANTGETSSGQRTLFVAYRKTLPASSITWTRQHKVVSGATSGIDEDAIAVLQSAASANAYTLTNDYGSFALTGQALSLKKASILAAVNGAYTLTGQPVGLSVQRQLAAVFGGYTLSGQVAVLKKDSKLIAGQGSYALNGQDVTLGAGRKFAIDQGSFALNGQDATLTYNNADPTLTAEYGSFALSGQDVGLSVARQAALDYGAFTLTGQDVIFTYTPAANSIQQGAGGGFVIRDGEEIKRRKSAERQKLQTALEKAIEALNPAKAEPEVKAIIKAAKAETTRLQSIKYDLLPAYDFTPLYAAVEQLQQLVDERMAFLRDEEEAIAVLLLTMH